MCFPIPVSYMGVMTGLLVGIVLLLLQQQASKRH